jgi:hypothetical protein
VCTPADACRSSSSSSDIALLQLSTPYDGVEVRIGGSTVDNVGRTVRLFGWGPLEPAGPYQNRLASSLITVLTDAECRAVYGDRIDVTRELCAASSNGGGSICIGDDGGPLVRVSSDLKKFELAGVASRGNSCGATAQPGIFTRAFELMEWIESVTIVPVNTPSFLIRGRMNRYQTWVEPLSTNVLMRPGASQSDEVRLCVRARAVLALPAFGSPGGLCFFRSARLYFKWILTSTLVCSAVTCRVSALSR